MTRIAIFGALTFGGLLSLQAGNISAREAQRLASSYSLCVVGMGCGGVGTLFCMALHGKYLSCLDLPAHRTAASVSTKLYALFLTAMAVEFILRCPRSSLPNESMISSIADRPNHALERTVAPSCVFISDD
jgi:hypothetical protein